MLGVQHDFNIILKMNMSMNYLVAAIGNWNKNIFINITKELSGNWCLVSTPEALNSKLAEGFSPKYIFFLHWRWFVPAEIHTKYECVCFHMTDVPYGRGGSPLQNLILAGHTETQLTALKMVEEMDAGPVYAKCPLRLTGKAQTIYENAGKLSFELIEWIIANNPKPKEQEGTVTTFKRRRPEQSLISENPTQIELYDFIRMLDAEGYPHAFINHGNLKLELTDVKLEADGIAAQVKIVFKADAE